MLITKKCDNSDSIEAYIAATQNELEIDRVSMTQAGLDRDFPYVLPRAMLFAHYAKKIPKPFKLLFRGLTLFWWFPIFPGIVFFQAVRYSFLRGCKKKKNLNGASNIIIGTTHRVADVVLRLSESRRPHVWLIVPWIQLISVPQSDMQIQLLSLSQWSDFLWALNKTWQGARSFANQAYRKTDRLQTYTAFTWFLTWRVLSEHAHGTTSWWYANHYDRWAILIDSIQLHVKKIMLQHGLILDYLKIPNKLMNVDEFYFFDDKSREIFKMNVLSNHTSIQFKKLSTTIKFTKLPLEPHFQKRILIIGQPISAEKECMLAEQLLLLIPNVKIYVKPHPLYSSIAYKSLQKLAVSVIQEQYTYPEVDVAISYYSTLGLEYECNGTPVVWHKDISVDETIEKVRSMLFVSECH